MNARRALSLASRTETVETVSKDRAAIHTWLKPGVNEKAIEKLLSL
jgi:hypothetical protein